LIVKQSISSFHVAIVDGYLYPAGQIVFRL